MRRDHCQPTRRGPLRAIALIALALGFLTLSACGGDNLSLCDGCDTPTPTLTPTPAPSGT